MKFLLDNYKGLSLVTRWLMVILAIKIILAFTLRLVDHTPTAAASSKSIEPVQSAKKLNSDSWRPMITALEHIKNHPDEPVYDALLNKRVEKFQYPLTSLLIFDLPQRILGMPYEKTTFLLDRISWFSLILMGLITTRLLWLLLRSDRFRQFQISSGYETAFLFVIIFLLTYFYYPLRMSYSLGQIQTILTFLGILALYCWQTNRKVLVGILIGLICLAKPQLALLFLWGGFRCEWKMIWGGTAVLFVFLLLSVKLYGFENNLNYLSALSFLSHHGEAYYANQSVNGLMNRLLFNGDNLTFSRFDFPAFSGPIYIVTLVTSLSLIALGLFRNYKVKWPNVLDMGLMILCATVASPIAWEHHYGILACIFITSLPFALQYYANRKWVLIILTIAFLLTAQNIEAVKQLANTRLNIFQSYLFFGALIILGFLFRLTGYPPKNSKMTSISHNVFTIRA